MSGQCRPPPARRSRRPGLSLPAMPSQPPPGNLPLPARHDSRPVDSHKRRGGNSQWWECEGDTYFFLGAVALVYAAAHAERQSHPLPSDHGLTRHEGPQFRKIIPSTHPMRRRDRRGRPRRAVEAGIGRGSARRRFGSLRRAGDLGGVDGWDGDRYRYESPISRKRPRVRPAPTGAGAAACPDPRRGQAAGWAAPLLASARSDTASSTARRACWTVAIA